MTSAHKPTCGRVRRQLLQLPAAPWPLDDDLQMLNEHLNGCPDCQAFMAEQRAWRRLGKRLQGRSETAPAAIRQRLFNTLAQLRAHWPEPSATMDYRRWRARAVWLFLPFVLAALAGGYWLAQSRGDSFVDTATMAMIEDHWREFHGQAISTHEKTAIEAWLQQHLALPIDVVEFAEGTLTGARLCFLNDEMGAVIRYRVGGEPVSYYIMPAGSNVAGNREALEQQARRGYNILSWYDRDLIHALVSALPRQRLRELAATCRMHLAQTSS